MSMCVHQGHLINQGIHWCELQKPGYPDCCQNCPEFEAAPEYVVTSTDAPVTNIEDIYATAKYFRKSKKMLDGQLKG